MKKWNNPELLNLMLQETKSSGDEQPAWLDGHTCYADKDNPKGCGSDLLYPWRPCLHDGVVQYDDCGLIVSCCNTSGGSTPPTFS